MKTIRYQVKVSKCFTVTLCLYCFYKRALRPVTIQFFCAVTKRTTNRDNKEKFN